MESEILTIEEVAKYLRVSERTVYDWAQKGELPCGRLGTSWRFKRSEVERWVNSRLGRSRYDMQPPSVSLRGAFSPERCIASEFSTKVEVLNELIDLLAGARQVRDRKELARAIFSREQLMSTGLGLGMGLPHVRLASVTDIVAGLSVTARPIQDYDSLDGAPVSVVIMVAAAETQHAEHVRLLSLVSNRLRDEEIRNHLCAAKGPQELYDVLVER